MEHKDFESDIFLPAVGILYSTIQTRHLKECKQQSQQQQQQEASQSQNEEQGQHQERVNFHAEFERINVFMNLIRQKSEVNQLAARPAGAQLFEPYMSLEVVKQNEEMLRFLSYELINWSVK